jgi:2-methylcitrate dehydratase PrpD
MSSPFASICAAAMAADTAEARAVTALSALDWMACGLAGLSEPVTQITRALIENESGAEQATLFGGGKAPMRGTALVNGAASHALDYDDTHFAHIGHPSVAVFPAALAVGEHVGATLPQILSAARYGAEASIRVGLRLGRGHYQTGFHQTATAGAFGACLAATRLMGLESARTDHALGLLTTRASGLKSQFGTMGKPFNAGIAAANGVEAAWLASRGFVSDPQAFDGPNGFLGTHHCDGDETQPDGALLATLSHGLHATLEALAMLPRLAPGQITAVTVTTHPRWLTVCHLPAPATGLEAKFSYRMVCALALLGHDTAALDTYRDALCQDPEIIALRKRVSVSGDDSLTETEAVVSIDAGGTFEAHFDLAAPMPLDLRATRLHQKAAALLGAERAARIWKAIETGDLAALVMEMSTPGTAS